MPKFTYVAQVFRQRPDEPTELLLFSAPAGELKRWAGVPRKTFDYKHGFQRTLNPTRVEELSNFFAEDPRNVSPTAVVLGVNTAHDHVKVVAKGKSQASLVTIEIDIPDFESLPIQELIDHAIEALEERLPEETVQSINEDIDGAISDAISTEDEDEVDEEFGAVDEEDAGGDGLQQPDRSFLADFYAELKGYQQKKVQTGNDEKLRQILYSLLKPAIIVDGQHRVFGAANADENIMMPVCALAGADWVENVYQFVVINQKAKPIKPAFLSTIIATSLTDDEITSVYDRLKVSKIDVGKAEIMDRVDRDVESPFRHMIDFEVDASPGFLQFPGMNKLVKDFQNIPKSQPVLLPGGVWSAATGDWILHFYSFWNGVKDYFTSRDERLWKEPTEANPNNLLKIVTLQEIQKLMLDNWADSRIFKFGDRDATYNSAKNFWDEFPATFFSDEWKQKGLQTSVGRRLLADAIKETRRNIGRKNWGHRRLKLFQD